MKQNIYDDAEFFEGYIALRKEARGYNDVVEKPALRALLPELTGLRILDIGCGYGEDCKWYVEQGAASVLGIDISVRMIGRAKMVNPDNRIEYLAVAMEEFEFPLGEFDLVTSSLGFHYVEEYSLLVKNIAKSLKPGGKIVFSQEHPVATAADAEQNWVLDEEGKKRAWRISDYVVQGKRSHDWLDKEVVIYHRSLAAILNELISEGLQIRSLEEPAASLEELTSYPRLYGTRIIPHYLVVSCQKTE